MAQGREPEVALPLLRVSFPPIADSPGENVQYQHHEININGVIKTISFPVVDGCSMAISGPLHTQSTQALPSQAKPNKGGRPRQANSILGQPTQAQPIHILPGPAQSIQAQPKQAQPMHAQPIQPRPIQPRPTQANSTWTQPTQVQMTPAQTIQAQLAPTQLSSIKKEAVRDRQRQAQVNGSSQVTISQANPSAVQSPQTQATQSQISVGQNTAAQTALDRSAQLAIIKKEAIKASLNKHVLESQIPTTQAQSLQNQQVQPQHTHGETRPTLCEPLQVQPTLSQSMQTRPTCSQSTQSEAIQVQKTQLSPTQLSSVKKEAIKAREVSQNNVKVTQGQSSQTQVIQSQITSVPPTQSRLTQSEPSQIQLSQSHSTQTETAQKPVGMIKKELNEAKEALNHQQKQEQVLQSQPLHSQTTQSQPVPSQLTQSQPRTTQSLRERIAAVKEAIIAREALQTQEQGSQPQPSSGQSIQTQPKQSQPSQNEPRQPAMVKMEAVKSREALGGKETQQQDPSPQPSQASSTQSFPEIQPDLRQPTLSQPMQMQLTQNQSVKAVPALIKIDSIKSLHSQQTQVPVCQPDSSQGQPTQSQRSLSQPTQNQPSLSQSSQIQPTQTPCLPAVPALVKIEAVKAREALSHQLTPDQGSLPIQIQPSLSKAPVQAQPPPPAVVKREAVKAREDVQAPAAQPTQTKTTTQGLSGDKLLQTLPAHIQALLSGAPGNKDVTSKETTPAPLSSAALINTLPAHIQELLKQGQGNKQGPSKEASQTVACSRTAGSATTTTTTKPLVNAQGKVAIPRLPASRPPHQAPKGNSGQPRLTKMAAPRAQRPTLPQHRPQLVPTASKSQRAQSKTPSGQNGLYPRFCVPQQPLAPQRQQMVNQPNQPLKPKPQAKAQYPIRPQVWTPGQFNNQILRPQFPSQQSPQYQVLAQQSHNVPLQNGNSGHIQNFNGHWNGNQQVPNIQAQAVQQPLMSANFQNNFSNVTGVVMPYGMWNHLPQTASNMNNNAWNGTMLTQQQNNMSSQQCAMPNNQQIIQMNHSNNLNTPSVNGHGQVINVNGSQQMGFILQAQNASHSSQGFTSNQVVQAQSFNHHSSGVPHQGVQAQGIGPYGQVQRIDQVRQGQMTNSLGTGGQGQNFSSCAFANSPSQGVFGQNMDLVQSANQGMNFQTKSQNQILIASHNLSQYAKGIVPMHGPQSHQPMPFIQGIGQQLNVQAQNHLQSAQNSPRCGVVCSSNQPMQPQSLPTSAAGINSSQAMQPYTSPLAVQQTAPRPSLPAKTPPHLLNESASNQAMQVQMSNHSVEAMGFSQKTIHTIQTIQTQNVPSSSLTLGHGQSVQTIQAVQTIQTQNLAPGAISSIPVLPMVLHSPPNIPLVQKEALVLKEVPRTQTELKQKSDVTPSPEQQKTVPSSNSLTSLQQTNAQIPSVISQLLSPVKTVETNVDTTATTIQSPDIQTTVTATISCSINTSSNQELVTADVTQSHASGLTLAQVPHSASTTANNMPVVATITSPSHESPNGKGSSLEKEMMANGEEQQKTPSKGKPRATSEEALNSKGTKLRQIVPKPLTQEQVAHMQNLEKLRREKYGPKTTKSKPRQILPKPQPIGYVSNFIGPESVATNGDDIGRNENMINESNNDTPENVPVLVIQPTPDLHSSVETGVKITAPNDYESSPQKERIPPIDSKKKQKQKYSERKSTNNNKNKNSKTPNIVAKCSRAGCQKVKRADARDLEAFGVTQFLEVMLDRLKVDEGTLRHVRGRKSYQIVTEDESDVSEYPSDDGDEDFVLDEDKYDKTYKPNIKMPHRGTKRHCRRQSVTSVSSLSDISISEAETDESDSSELYDSELLKPSKRTNRRRRGVRTRSTSTSIPNAHLNICETVKLLKRGNPRKVELKQSSKRKGSRKTRHHSKRKSLRSKYVRKDASNSDTNESGDEDVKQKHSPKKTRQTNKKSKSKWKRIKVCNSDSSDNEKGAGVKERARDKRGARAKRKLSENDEHCGTQAKCAKTVAENTDSVMPTNPEPAVQYQSGNDSGTESYGTDAEGEAMINSMKVKQLASYIEDSSKHVPIVNKKRAINVEELEIIEERLKAKEQEVEMLRNFLSKKSSEK